MPTIKFDKTDNQVVQELQYTPAAIIAPVTHPLNPIAYMRLGYVHSRIIIEEGRPVDFIHLEVNASYERLTGLKNVVGRRMTEVLPGIADSNPEFIEAHRKAVETGIAQQFEVYLRVLAKWFDITVYSPQKGESVAMFDDITLRKQHEEAIVESEERFRLLFENHSAVMIILDPETGDILNANHAAARFYGWSIDELRQMRIQQITNVTPEAVKNNMEYARTSQQNQFLFRHRRADGSICDVEVFSNSITIEGQEYLYAIIHDITRRLNTEDAQRKSEKQLEKKYQTLIAASPDTIITTDLEGIISSVSAVGLEIFGINNISEIIGLPFSTIVYPDNIAILHEIFDITLREGLIQNREILLQQKNHTVYSAEISAALILDYIGKPSSYMMIIRNISQRKLIESELFHAKRLISLGEMASGIAHEIYQPINNIGLVLDKMLMKASNSNWSSIEDIKIMSDKIFENIIRVQTIIDNIRSFSSSDNNYISSVININKSIRNVLMMVSEQCKHRSITLDFKPDEEQVTAAGNVYKFEQVIHNLIRNSIDALEERKQLSQSAYDMTILIRSFYDNGFITVSVEDTGIGISEQNIEYIMHPFYTTKDSGKGSGLGLSISYGIIQEMNGDIKITSTPMIGTCVVITLPIKH